MITSPLVAIGTVGLPFTYQFQATGATSLGVDNLPQGLMFNLSLGAITGTPAASGLPIQVGLSATNSAGTANAILIITVQLPPASGPIIINGTAGTGRTGRPFNFQLQAIGGSSETRFAVDGLPLGLSLDPSTGFISGTPLEDGSFSLAVSAIDGPAITHATVQLTFVSDPTVPIITSAGTAILTPGQFFSYTITADANGTFGYMGRDGIVRFGGSCEGLPAGLCFDGIDTISGIFDPAFEHDRESKQRPDQTGGIVTNVQLFSTDPSGTGTFPLVAFIAAKDAVQISTRMAVGNGENALIGGFIVAGSGTTKALIRAIGPSLKEFGVPDALLDPKLELRGEGGVLLGSNDNWRASQETPIHLATDPPGGLEPANDLESAILAYLSPGSYTAILSGINNSTGVGLVEVYDLGIAYPQNNESARLANISTRGTVESGDNVMIGGFIIRHLGPTTNTRVVIRAIGPSLAAFGIMDALQDPTLELRDGNGTLLLGNDDWQDDPAQAAEITAAGLAPSDVHESAIVMSLPADGYTAIVRGKNNTAGVALVEAYALP